MSDGPIDTNAPEEKPYRTQNIMIGMLPDDGSQSASTTIAENPVVMIITLNRPTLSAIIPGRIRPKILTIC
mgnify:CR=1 FL=1